MMLSTSLQRRPDASARWGSSARIAFPWLVCLFVLLTLSSTGLAQKTEDQKFVDGLRSRQLFQLADKYIARRLADEKISATDEGNLIIELVRTRMAAAIHTDEASRAEAWNSAVAIGEDFVNNRNHPRELVIRVQSELVRLSYGKYLAQQLAAGISGNNLRERAIDEISKARRGLERIDRQIAIALPQAGRGLDALTAAELRSLQKNVQFQIASCNLEAAKLFPKDDQINRVDALFQVLQRLEQVANQTNSQMPLWWSVQIDRIEAMRLQGRLDQVADEIKKLSTKEILNSDQRKSDVLRLQIELSLDLGRGDPVQLVSAARSIKQTSPELDLSVVRLMMQTGSAARQTEERDKWQQAASSMAKSVGRQHGPYWGRLAELVLIGGDSGSTVASSTSLDILMGAGDEAWRKKNFEDAVKAFDKAMTQAESEGNQTVAMAAGMKAAKILEEQSRNKDAGQRLVSLAVKHGNHESAAAAHLSGCWNLGRAAATEEELLDEYAQQLATHIASWPNAKTVAQARIWLGRFQGSKKQWKDSFDTLVDVPAESRFLVEAAKLLPYVANAHVSELTGQNQPTVEACEDFAKRMQDKLIQAGVGPNDRWTDATRELLLSTLQFSLRNHVGDQETLGRLLKRAITESTDAKEEWRRPAAAWLVVVKAAKSETVNESIELAGELSGFGEAVLARCYDGVVRLRSTAESSQLNELKLKLVDLALSQVAQDENARNRWLSRKSLILIEAGRGQEAIGMLQKLIEASPKRADLQVALARAFTAAEGRAEEALNQWRRVAKGSRQQSSNWFEAKYHVAKLLADSGKKEEAKQLLDYLKIPPGWEKSNLKNEFDRLYSDL